MTANEQPAFAYLRAIPIFGNLAAEQLQLIDQKTTLRHYGKGEFIFFEGEPGRGFHYVRTGKVKIVKTSDDGREHIIKILNPGDLFAEVLLFSDQTYPATAVAVEDSQIGLIQNADLEQLILQNNALALQLIKALSQRLLYAQEKIKQLALQDVLARTAETLLRLAEEHGKPDGKRVEIQLDLSRQELASLVGTTRETVTRTLMAMKKDGIIDFNGQRTILLDKEYLERLAM